MLSIIVPVLNQSDMTHECIYSIMDCTQDYEIVIIDNGSEPVYVPPFVSNGEVQLIRNDENKGFPIAANQGIKASRGDTIVLFNNDVVVTPGWASRLLDHLEDSFDIVAPMTNYAAGLQGTMANGDQSIDSYNTKEQLYDAGLEFGNRNKGLATEVNFATISMFIKREIFDDIGYLDESLFPSSGEDLDFCFRARKAGYRIGIAHDVYIHHEGSQTFKDLESSGVENYNDIIEQNNKHLEDKWGKGFWENQIVYDDKQVGIKEGTRLNLGSGGYNMEGFINIDQFERVAPDIVANVTNLPYEKDSVDEIYCGHLLEHLTWNEGQSALMHWIHMLKPGSEIRIVVPNFDVLAKMYLENPIPSEMINLNNIYIYSYIQDSLHRFFYSESLLKYAMAEVGFTDLELMPKDHPYLVEPVDWQIGWKGTKP